MVRPLDLTKKRFGSLVAVRPYSAHPVLGRQWVCLCDCGALILVPARRLNDGSRVSCGCRRRRPRGKRKRKGPAS